MWFRWQSRHQFDGWHQQVVAALNLPRVGSNAQTGEPQPDKQMTTAYTQPSEVGEGDWRAFVEPHVAAGHPDGLGEPSDAPPDPVLHEGVL